MTDCTGENLFNISKIEVHDGSSTSTTGEVALDSTNKRIKINFSSTRDKDNTVDRSYRFKTNYYGISKDVYFLVRFEIPQSE